MKNYSVENLTEDQLRLVVEALLFSASTSVNARWYSEEDESLMKLALDLRKKYPEVLMKNIFILKEKEYHDQFAGDIVDYFPEIVETAPVL
jgi:hypothetical protein